ncbi:hypothetical protein HG536_0E01540 [Torulaspora globosa]|uniref:CRAL-TRIO domain-containing protein n=1 Tax=Torulaspora globosa TaxID=48254 RepID=A0A7G3ZIA7_9SACH|nr:uncharacterized protein HG536_0E01540 [Torulaspora globosa]QLL33243.1 hypothetical protein HG536_0E01540 [Torulaspora globosa]
MTIQSNGSWASDLTQPQKKALKQVWTYLFHFWGIPVNGEAAFRKQQGPSSGPFESSSDAGKKKKGLFGKLQASYYGDDQESSGNDNIEEVESEYVADKIHDSLKELDPEATRDEFWEMLRFEEPDAVILKFIRARKWKVDKALSMIAHSMHWRVDETQVDDILNGGETAIFRNNEQGVIKNLQLQKAFISGRDKQGRPIILARPKLHHSHDQSEAEMEKYCILVIEQARLFFKSPVETATILFDLSGFSMSNMDYGPVKFLINCFEAHYPESLGHMFIHKAPWIFHPIWNIVKNWMDPVVVSKIKFTKNLTDLNDYIELDQLPKYMGGESAMDPDAFTKPDESQDAKMQDEAGRAQILSERNDLIQKFVAATVSWIEADDDEESSKCLNEKVTLGSQLTANYSELDPYIRSRSMYDVNGMLKA